MQSTFEAKLKLTTAQAALLTGMARELSVVERHLYQRLFVKQENGNRVKRDALGEFGITGRQYNAAAVPVASYPKPLARFNKIDVKRNVAFADG